MQWLVDIINSPNFIRLSVTLIIFGMGAWLLTKSGILYVHTKYVTLGIADKERNILRQQMIHAHQSCLAFEQFIPKREGYNEDRGKCVCEYVYDEMINWIVLNHIEDTNSYIELRQTAVWNIILAHVYKPEHISDKFKAVVFQHVAEDIKTLVRIRKEYSD